MQATGARSSHEGRDMVGRRDLKLKHERNIVSLRPPTDLGVLS